jgi:hypothetical protein
MTGDKKWFSSLTPVKEKMYITFGDNGRGKVISEGVVHVSDKVTFFLNENRGATPPGNRKNIIKEETKLQRGGTYARTNQQLGNEGGLAKRETTAEKTTGARGGRGATQQQSSTTRKAIEH